MTYEELYNLVPRAFWNAVDGYYDYIENENRKEWIRIRWSTCCLVNIKLPRGKQITPQKLIHFDWEKDKKEIQSYEDTLFKYKKFMKQKKVRK